VSAAGFLFLFNPRKCACDYTESRGNFRGVKAAATGFLSRPHQVPPSKSDGRARYRKKSFWIQRGLVFPCLAAAKAGEVPFQENPTWFFTQSTSNRRAGFMRGVEKIFPSAVEKVFLKCA
jgi:hypothetical protein